MNRVYQIEEYGCLVAERQVEGCVALPSSTFANLESFLLTARGGADPLELMGVSARRGVGHVLTARNYVGVIVTADGAVIEILPKICSAAPEGNPRVRARRLLIEMLSELPDAPYRALQSTGVDTARMNLLKAFVRMFIDEVFAIVRRGLRCDYVHVEEDARYLRGKLDLPRHIRENAAHRERFAVICDRYTADRPENRLLKSTLLFLRRHSGSPQNLRDLRLLLDTFAAVPPSVDGAGDLRRCAPDRNTRDYTRALLWCRVFLTGRGFTSFAGDDVALALLFPMEALFERYVARRLRRKLSGVGYSVSFKTEATASSMRRRASGSVRTSSFAAKRMALSLYSTRSGSSCTPTQRTAASPRRTCTRCTPTSAASALQAQRSSTPGQKKRRPKRSAASPPRTAPGYICNCSTSFNRRGA